MLGGSSRPAARGLHPVTSESLDQRLPAARADRVPRGILYMVGATVMFAVSMAIAKWQVASYSFAEVLFYRSVGSLAVCAVLILPRTGLTVFRSARLRDHLGRSGTQAVAQSLLIVAFSLMPLGGAIAINFSAPLFATLFAALWLKEKVGLARGCALAAGFFGVLLVAAPVPTASASARCSRSAMRCCSAASPRQCAA